MAAANPIGIAIQPGQDGGPGASSSNRGRVRPRGKASVSGAARSPGAGVPGMGVPGSGAPGWGAATGIGCGSGGGAGSDGREAYNPCQVLVARRRAPASGARQGTRSADDVVVCNLTSRSG